MNELLVSIRTDLSSRRMLPLVVLVAVALVAAIAYAVLGGKAAGSPSAVASTPVSPAVGMPLSTVPPSTTAVNAETPAGAKYQTRGSTRNPFSPLPGSSSKASSSSASSAKAAASKSSGVAGTSGGKSQSSSSSTATGGSSGSESGAGANKPSKEKPRSLKPEPLIGYSVSALFGRAPANPGETPTLTPYEEMKRFEPLPSAKEPLLVFIGVLAKHGSNAVFAFIVPPILHGEGSCYPSATHCQAVELAPGKSEELEYVKRDGEAVAFELKVVSIVKQGTASGAKAKSMHVSRAGRSALRRAGLGKLA